MTSSWKPDPLDDAGAETTPEPAAPGPAPQLARTPYYLEGLNPEQRSAVEALDGPVLVLAGAGTGKTRVLTTRLAHLLTMRRAWPSQILSVTFTNKAAREMKERVSALTGAPVEGWWLGTFHAMAARLLRRHAELVGLKSNFTILDSDDQLRLIKQLLEAESIDAKRWPARLIHGVIERWKDKGLTPDRLKPDDAGDIAGGRLIDLYRAYQERLRTLNACDFGDLLLHNLAILQDNAEVLTEYHRRFRYILVDEYQDTNVAQYLWLRLLAQGHKNLCCVGDDDQSIYGWRGAEVGNILRFETDFPGAKVIRLERNYRSTDRILGAASGLIAQNRGRLGKTLFTESAGGEHVLVRNVWDGEEEARWVGDEIESLQRQKTRLSEIAILVRAGFQMREFEERLLTLGIPYRVVGGPRFYERVEIRDALAYLRVIAQPDDDLAFERIVNTPRRGLGAATLKTLHQLARGTRVPLTEAALRVVDTDEVGTRARNSLRTLMGDFQRWRDMIGRVPHPELARIVLDESGYTAMWQNEKSPDAAGRLENLKELVAAMEEFENLQGFLEHVSLVMENTATPGADMVNLMTLHSAKGLEFEHVFLPGWEEGLFPHQRALDETGIAGLEEERRLAYVGLTRAKLRAYISAAANRRIHGLWQAALPSRFLDELPEEHVEVRADPGLGGDLRETGPSFAFQTPRQSGFMARSRPVTLDGVAYAVAERPRPDKAFAAGDRVFHRKFGYGTVRTADNDKLTIGFDHAGEKKVMDSFVVPADQAG
ncbi:MAG: UvrD-helicase domain-containing protein [Inquilinus sp.]|nr:UvrD-helicase domain-containing protein [Inquilinus sp.]